MKSKLLILRKFGIICIILTAELVQLCINRNCLVQINIFYEIKYYL